MTVSHLAERLPDTAPLKAAKSIGLILLESGKLSAQDAERVLKLQKEQNLRFGEAAVKLGLVSQADIQLALAQQFAYPYLAPGEGGLSLDLTAAYQPYSPEVESLRTLRSQLMLRWFEAERHALAIASARPDDGSSLIAANLAIVFSQLGERTLLIDANLRNPTLHTLFKLDNRAGLSDLLAERADLGVLVRVPHLLDLTLLSAGPQPPNPSELLARPRFAQLLGQLSSHFDVILIDTPPAVIAADYQPVSRAVGGALLCVRKHRARLREVAALRDALTAAGVQLVGAVLNAR